MPAVARDRTARARVRDYLLEHGPVEDVAGGATALLKRAVRYRGSAGAFIQLVTAMDQAGEITREIRGKRTFAIAAPAAAPGPSADTEVDYDQLARAVLRELAAGAPADAASAQLRELRRECDRLRVERDGLERELQTLRAQLTNGA